MCLWGCHSVFVEGQFWGVSFFLLFVLCLGEWIQIIRFVGWCRSSLSHSASWRCLNFKRHSLTLLYINSLTISSTHAESHKAGGSVGNICDSGVLCIFQMYYYSTDFKMTPLSPGCSWARGLAAFCLLCARSTHVLHHAHLDAYFCHFVCILKVKGWGYS